MFIRRYSPFIPPYRIIAGYMGDLHPSLVFQSLSATSRHTSLSRKRLVMMSPATARTYDSIVIGSGQGGTPLAMALAKSGRRTALIESVHIGGTCVNEGCTPTKTMVASAKAAWHVSRANQIGVLGSSERSQSIKMDMGVVRRRKRNIVDSFRGGSERRVEETDNLDLFMGLGKFRGPKEVEIALNEGGQSIALHVEKEIFINTGCRPRELNLPGIEDVNALNSTSIMELDVVPEHLVVVGGGYVGLEFGQMFRRFGADVTIINSEDHLLQKKEDEDVGREIEKILKEDGVTIVPNARPASVTKRAGGVFDLLVKDSAGKETTISGSHLLAAAGRTPNTDYLSPEIAGVKLDSHGFIIVSPTLETSTPGIYALGDVTGGPAFTHISYDDFRIIRNNVINSSPGRPSDESIPIKTSTTDRLVPYTMFTDPQYGRVGHSEATALALYDHDRSKIQVAKMPMSYVARALEIDETRGLMKAIVEKESQKIIGFMCVGAEGGEIMNMIQIAIMGGVRWPVLQDAIFAHPTFGESLNNLWGFLK